MAQVHSSTYRAFDSINFPHLATLGVDVDWNHSSLLQVSFPCSLHFFQPHVHCPRTPCRSHAGHETTPCAMPPPVLPAFQPHVQCPRTLLLACRA